MKAALDLATSLGVKSIDCRRMAPSWGWRGRVEAAARKLSFQFDDHGHRRGRCDPARRREPAQGSGRLNARIRKPGCAWFRLQ
jgi:hypothetical protein